MNLPWYVYLMLAITAISYFFIKILPFLKKAKQVIQSKDYNKNPAGGNLTTEQKQAISIGAVLAEQNSLFIDSLETALIQSEVDVKKGLNEWWGIFDKNSAVETMDRLKNSGHRQYYTTVLDLVLNHPKSTWDATIQRNYGDNEQALGFVYNLADTIKGLKGPESYNNISDEDFERGIDAWDMGRLVYLARMSYHLKFINENETWFYINAAHQRSKEAYNSWKEFGKAYVIGRAMWGGNNMGLDGIKHIVDDLQKDEDSPWHGLDW